MTTSHRQRTTRIKNRHNAPAPADKAWPWTRCGLIALAAICFWSLPSCRKDTKQPGIDKTFEIDKKYQRGPVTFAVKASRKEITIADRITLVLEVIADEAYQIELPKFGDKLEQFGIVDYDQAAPNLIEGGKIRRRRSYTLEPFLSGDYKIPPMKVTFWKEADEKAKKHEIESEEIVIKVTSLLPEKIAELKLKELAGPVELPPPGRSRPYIAIAAALVALAGVVGVIVWQRRRRPGAPEARSIPAHEIAYDQLEKLIKEQLIEQGQFKLFHIRISDILRHYIENRFALRAPERTTEEFLNEIRDSGLLDARQKILLREFLNHCDLVKFAEHQPTNGEIQKTFDNCKQFILETQMERPTNVIAG